MSAPPLVTDPSDTLAVLRAAREWLDDPAHWTTRSDWRNATRQPVYTRSEVASTCAVGALSLVAGVAPRAPAISRSLAALKAQTARLVTTVNDGFDGYPRILAAYDQAIAALEAERA